MEYTIEERIGRIVNECLNSGDTNPVKLFYKIANKDFIRIHGPEHHFLDGACILTTFYNSGGKVDLKEGLKKLREESLKMPGAMCGYWGVCGAVTSIGAALSFIDKTGPLSKRDWGCHMECTAKALLRLASTGGPRCCKRDAFFAMETAIEYINESYEVEMHVDRIECAFSHKNEQCLKEGCPFYVKN